MARSLPIALALTLFVSDSAVSATVTYSISGLASGSVAGNPFDDSSFVIEVLADADDVTRIDGVGPNGDDVVFAVQALVASISIEGVGSGTIDEEMLVFVNQTRQGAGFSLGRVPDLSTISDLIDVEDPGFSSFDLTGPFGPVVDPAPILFAAFNGIATTLGPITVSSLEGPATFTASTAIPEPSSLALLALPAVLAAGRLSRRAGRRA
ncbi:hypothetical protein [Tautonia plasticadhaerens]|uniref:PEP-CTERM protein-sorting domain-containing protein n=1 Tax=Tautonia plasticadhaerens TaxID=2527974 RepID=A0A518HBW0_9BACT|nr:hypothetical protein [Tautonia plasticadhaerens]QDV38317.1 hypothetical protein ElP_62690 [Tautonia plasticadhaerens]